MKHRRENAFKLEGETIPIRNRKSFAECGRNNFLVGAESYPVRRIGEPIPWGKVWLLDKEVFPCSNKLSSPHFQVASTPTALPQQRDYEFWVFTL